MSSEVELMSEGEVARMLGVRPRTVGVWRRKRGVVGVRVGAKVVRYRRGEVEKWLEGFNRKDEQ